MANHKSAEKRARQAEVRRERNRSARSRMRTVVKGFLSAVESGAADVTERFREAERTLRRAAAKGLIPKRRASRHVSRLAKRRNAGAAPKA